MTLANVTVNTITSAAGTALTLQSNNGNTAVTVNTSQNVGIGTTSPAYKLDVAGVISTNNNLTFTGTANRITGDFSNATLTNRVSFQTSTVNAATIITVLPNGTNTTSQLNLECDPASANGAVSQIISSSDEFRLAANIRGTGTYAPMTFQTGGGERVRIDTSGNVGIGTSSPSGKLDARGDVYLGSTSAGYTTYVRTTANWNYTGLNVIRNSSNASTTKGIEFLYDGDSLGNTTIGGTNAIWTFANASPTTSSTTSGLQSGLTYGAYYGHRWNVNGTESMRIDSSGRWLLKTSSVLNGGTARGSILFDGSIEQGLFIASSAGATPQCMGFNYNTTTNVGSINITSSATSYSTSSDYRLKENIVAMSDALATVAQLKPVKFKWKSDGSDGQGFIAHELQQVVPDCVVGTKDAVDKDGNPKHQSVDTSFLVATLTAAIQEQQALIASLTDRIAALEAK
jgi:hypothetical protein